jgi:hypothetical protein
LTFSPCVKQRDGTLTPIDPTLAQPKWYSKPTVQTPDAQATVIAGTPIDTERFTVQLTSAVTQTAGRYVYKVVVARNFHPLTVQYGELWITDT